MPAVWDASNLGISALVTVGMQTTFYCIAAYYQFDKLTDFAGGTNFIVVAVLTFFLGQKYPLQWNTIDIRKAVVTSMICLWGARLVTYLVYRILKIERDNRFDEMRHDPLKFAVFWVFQAAWVFIVSLPVMFVNAPNNSIANGAPKFGNARDIAGICLFVVGLLVETVADLQKNSYRNNPDNRGHWCDVGLWSWSRHPNYFGEITIWSSVFLISTNVLKRWQWTAVLSPVFTAVLLLFVSGMPILEKSADRKYGNREDYLSYKKSTSPLIPLPPSIFQNLPQPVKFILFEYPMYNNTEAAGSPLNTPTENPRKYS
ncbi:Protein of unknown function (DUF1295) [Nesidiocoris tenuis]|uniref:Steroid 5-alpha reductase C-terminal domain-containing protein n=1 Tax=Nesidiocoris tenuis TaxID=355587 RepID=A0ABN7B6R2_9HEMI|nr:Protein of unknown function (DUF1295) [Nesidiocoris tenuis]